MLDDMYKISIIIPVYNTGSYLMTAIESCLKQSYKNIEIIIIDDGSTDDKTIQLLQEYSLNSLIKVFHQKNQGAAKARDYGVEISSGDYLFFLDSDDYIPQDAIELLVNSSLENSSDLVMAPLATVYSSRTIKLPFLVPSNLDKFSILDYLLLGKLPFSLGSKLISKRLFLSLSENTHNLKIGEDAYIVIQLVYMSKKCSFVNEPLYYYVQREESIFHCTSSLVLATVRDFVSKVISFFENNYERERFVKSFNSLSVFVQSQYYSLFLKKADKKILDKYTKSLDFYIQNSESIRALPIQQRVFIWLVQNKLPVSLYMNVLRLLKKIAVS